MKLTAFEIQAHKLACSPMQWAGGRVFSSTLLLFAVIPCIFLVISLQLRKVSGPQWLGSNFENNYVYLFNSLLIVNGEPPFHTDHPGTTTQLFGAAVLKATGNQRGDQLNKTALDHPEKFLRRIHTALLIFCTLALWIFPWLISARIGSYIQGLLLQFPILFFKVILHYSIWFCSELTLVAFSIGTVSLCLLLLSQGKKSQKLPTAILAGAACGLGIVTKLTFFPLILITLVCCRGVKSYVTFVAGLLVAASLALIPIYPELPRIFRWISALSTHAGRYGGGAQGLATNHYLADATTLLSGEPFVWLIPLAASITMVLLTICSGWNNLDSSRRYWMSRACAVFIVQTVSFIVLARHPGYRYLIPLYLSTGLNLAILWQLSSPGISGAGMKSLGLGVAILLVGFGISGFLYRTPRLYRSLRATRDSELAIYSRKNEKTKNSLTVFYWGAIGPEFASWDGNAYSRSAFADILEKKFPSALFYNVNNGNFQTFRSVLKPEDVLKTFNHFFLFGNKTHAAADDYEFLLRPEYYERVRWFNTPRLRLVDREGPYVLEEWTRE